MQLHRHSQGSPLAPHIALSNSRNAPELTQEQKLAVSHRSGPACVIAGVGTGKTQTLCERIVYLVKKKRLKPEKIAVTTFTRKATAELYQRAREKLGDRTRKLKISTIDALTSDLAAEAARRGWLSHFQLIGDAEQRVLLRECAWEAWSDAPWTLRIDSAFKDAQSLQALLEYAYRAEVAEDPGERHRLEQQLRQAFERMRGNWWDKTSEIFSGSGCYSWRTARIRLKDCTGRYLQKIKKFGFCDHDGLRQRFLRLLREDQNIRREFTSRFHAVLVDEFQDTSSSQAEVLRLLAGRNLWIVGDPCQQIYEWRGANPDPLKLIRKLKAKRYFLTQNFRSTQPILDNAFRFLSKRLPRLRKEGMLGPLDAAKWNGGDVHPAYRGNLDQALRFASALLNDRRGLSPSDIAILSRDLTSNTIKRLERKAGEYALQFQFHSTSTERALEKIIGTASHGGVPHWKAGEVLNKLYHRREIFSLLGRSLRHGDFEELRTLRPLAMAADAVDRASSLPFDEAWPALKKTQDRDVTVTAAVVPRKDAVQVMTIHAAKGLEFPIVLLMTWGKKFPREGSAEDARLAYVGMTRAKHILVLVHTMDRLQETLGRLKNFGRHLSRVPYRREEIQIHPIQTERARSAPPPLVAATHLDLYRQCPLKFAAYHEGRFLPEWSKSQSMGSRMHKALELFLSAWPNADISKCLQEGLKYGDSPLRKLPRPIVERVEEGFRAITDDLRRTCKAVIDVEHRYRYVGSGGQVEGAIDALVENRQGAMVLKEWKTSPVIPSENIRKYRLQACAGLLGSKFGKAVDLVELVPVLSPEKLVRLKAKELRENAPEQLENIFKAVQNRKYDPQKGPHCKRCPLKRQCPAWARG